MRYFDDGDLTEGLNIAPKPYPFGLLLGYWHAVSTCFAGERATVDYDDPEAPALFRLQLEAIDGRLARPDGKGKGKSKRPRDEGSQDDLLVTLNYKEWHLEFTGIYNTDGPATNLYLSSNETPEAGDVDKEATLAFGTVLDDRGYPFLRIGLSACEADSGSDDMQSIEIVAKRTDTTEVHKLELSKNERLRLGFAVRSDGQFEDLIGTGDATDSYEALTRQLNDNTRSSARIVRQLTKIRQEMDDQLREAAASGNVIHSIWKESRFSAPPRNTGDARQQPPVISQKLPASAPRPSSAPRPTTVNSAHAAPGAKRHRQTDRENRVPQAPHSAPAKIDKGKRYCPSCDKTVSLSHGAWVKHIESRRHAEQVKAAGGTVQKSNKSSTLFSTPNKSTSQPNSRGGLQTRSSGNAKPRSTNHRNSAPTPSFTDPDDEDVQNEAGRIRYDLSDYSSEEEAEADMELDEEDDEDASIVDRRAVKKRRRATDSNLRSPRQQQQNRTSRAPKPSSGGVTRRRRGVGQPGATQWCQYCKCQISVKNWNVHTRSNKHQVNSGGDGVMVNGEHAPTQQPPNLGGGQTGDRLIEAAERQEGAAGGGGALLDVSGMNGLENGVVGGDSQERDDESEGSLDTDTDVEGRPKKRNRVGIRELVNDIMPFD